MAADSVMVLLLPRRPIDNVDLVCSVHVHKSCLLGIMGYPERFQFSLCYYRTHCFVSY